MATSEKLGNKTVPTDKEYRRAVRRVIDGESQFGDRDKFATVARLFFQDSERGRKLLLQWYRSKREEKKA